MTATLLPNGKQQFLTPGGEPLVDGRVYFFIPNTTTPKNTWQNSGQTILNTNPVVLDGNGQAIIFGAGEYRQIVRDADGNLIWDQLTSSTGNVIGPSSATDGHIAVFDGATGQLIEDGGIALSAIGDVEGPASAADGNIPLFDGTSGKILKDSGVALSSIYPPRCATVYNTVAQTIPTGTQVALTFDTALINDASIWSLVNPTRLTVPSGVTRARFSANVRYEDIAAADVFLDITLFKNGSSTLPLCGFYQVTSSPALVGTNHTAINATSAIIPVTAGDYFEAKVLQKTGGNLDTRIAQPGQTWFSMEIVL